MKINYKLESLINIDHVPIHHNSPFYDKVIRRFLFSNMVSFNYYERQLLSKLNNIIINLQCKDIEEWIYIIIAKLNDDGVYYITIDDLSYVKIDENVYIDDGNKFLFGICRQIINQRFRSRL